MKRGLVILWAAAVGLLIPPPLSAHHSSASFETGKRVILKGTVKQWVYSNPHCFLMLEVKGEDGQVMQWLAEGQAPNVIFPAGYRVDTFKAGDAVTITVEPSRDGRPIGRIISSVLADGRTLGVASSAGAAPPQ